MGQVTATLAEAMANRGLNLAAAAALFEQAFIAAVLERHNGNYSHAAHGLGIHRNTLRSKLRRANNGSRHDD